MPAKTAAVDLPVTVTDSERRPDAPVPIAPHICRPESRDDTFANRIREAYLHIVAGNFKAAEVAMYQLLTLPSGTALPLGGAFPDGSVGRVVRTGSPLQKPRDREIRVRTLGGFSIEVQGQPLCFGRKTPKRVLSLFKAIVAAGGREVSACHLSDLLWPQLDGDRAHGVLNVTLHRLRQVLRAHDVVRMRSGCIDLNLDRIWIDALEMEAATVGTNGELPPTKLLMLYRGPFLPADTDASWASSLRIRLTSRFVRAVNEAALRLEEIDDYAGAALLYERGVERDDLGGVLQEGLRRNIRKLHWR